MATPPGAVSRLQPGARALAGRNMLDGTERKLRGLEGPMAVGQGFPAPGGGRGQMRAADADRDRAVNYLSTAYTEGRLGKDEYDSRLETALSARTYAELDQVVTDLPGARVGPVPRRSPSPTNELAI